MKVLVALDTSTFADHIIDALLKRHWPADCEFYLATVVESPTGWFSSTGYATTDARGRAESGAAHHIQELARHLKQRLPQHAIYSDVRHGAASEQIVSMASEFDADLIIIGQQGSAKAGGSSLGGVADYVVQKAHCSVEVVKPKIVIEKSPGTAGQCQERLIV